MNIKEVFIMMDWREREKMIIQRVKEMFPKGTSVMGEKEWQKKECGKNIKKAGDVGIVRDC